MFPVFCGVRYEQARLLRNVFPTKTFGKTPVLIGVLLSAILFGADDPFTQRPSATDIAYFVTQDSDQESNKVASPEHVPPKPSPVKDLTEPEQLLNDAFPAEEFEPRMPQSVAQPGVSQWWVPSDVPAGSWQARDDVDESLTSWFANLELAIVKAHVVSDVNSGSLLSPTFSDPLQIPASPLGISVMPSFTVGKISPTAGTGFQVQYRFLLSSGLGATSTPGVDALNQLVFNVVDLDYLYRQRNDNPISGLPGSSTVSMGLRFASINNRFSLQPWAPGQEAATNSDIGFGPRFGITREFPLATSGWVAVLQGDGAGLLANNHQTFARNEINPMGGGLLSASGSSTDGTGLATGSAKGALQYQGEWRGRTFNFQGGYRWERWWFLGTSNSNLELTIQGPYVQFETRY